MKQSEIIFGLQELAGIGWKTIEALTKLPFELHELFNISAAVLMKYGIHRNKAITIEKELTRQFIRERQALYAEKQIGILTRLDPNYPALLNEIADPPWVLYYKGKMELLQRPPIAVVGTRYPSAYGRKMAYRIGRQLSDAGFCVVSGLARGIDGISHLAALEGAAGTIGVTAGGLDIMYPKEHVPLYKKMFETGLVVSEFPLSTQIRKVMFPLRNRIIAGLSWGTVVVEGGHGSGSLITAQLALDESRDVFAVPGPVTSPKSAGALTLLKDGAKMVISIHDIIEEYQHMISESPVYKSTSTEQDYEIPEAEREILQLIPYEPIQFDDIMHKSKASFGHLHSVLLSLLLKNKIQQLPGSLYIRADR